MNRGIVSGRYARALLMYAEKYGKEVEVYYEAKWLSHCMIKYPQIKRILSSPVVSASKKLYMIEKLFAQPMSEQFGNLIGLVLEKKREESLQTICIMYMEYYREAKQILKIELITATPVTEDIKTSITGKMEKITHKQIRLITTTNPEILGGYVVYWDTYRWDASIASRMRQVKKKIIETMKNI
jgi:F-type H+-transporting ATPase subunit delta